MGRVSSWVFVALIFAVLAGLVASCGGDSSDDSGERPEETASSARTGADEKVEATGRGEASEKEEKDETAKEATETAKEATEAEREDRAAEPEADQYAEAPADPTLYLSIPKLGISDALVIDGEAGLEAGAMHLAGTGYPWLPGSNTYIAGHRVGFPGTGSDRIFYDLPAMAVGDEVVLEDTIGQTYTYAVSEIFAVTPTDLWVTAPTGSDMVTLQVCTETPDDWWTIGPSLMSSGPESGRLIVRAARV